MMMTDSEATRAMKAVLRKAFPGTKFEVSASRGMIRWTDDGPSIEQTQDTIFAAGCVEAETWNNHLRFHLRGRYLCFDRYNAADRAADQKDFARLMQEQQAQRQREIAAVAAAKQAKALPRPERSYSWSPAQDRAADEEAYAAFESLRQRAEADVAIDDAERQRRPSWAPPLIIEGELLQACIALGLLKPDDKPIARLWAGFADPRKPGRVMVSEKPRLRQGASQGRVRRLCPLLTNKTILGACRHYRANATIDFETDTAEKERKMATPLLVLWGTRGAPPTQEYPTVWRRFASNLVDAQPLPTGHALQVEAPGRVYDHFMKFFTA